MGACWYQVLTAEEHFDPIDQGKRFLFFTVLFIGVRAIPEDMFEKGYRQN
jgi:hypothetical protein